MRRTHLLDRELAEARARSSVRNSPGVTPPAERYPQEYEAGAAARKGGVPAKNSPYCFCNTPHYPNDTSGFNQNYRHRLDAWMRGWIDENKRIAHARP